MNQEKPACTIDTAREILGSNRVVSPLDHAHLWDSRTSTPCPIPYDMASLSRCAAKNIEGLSDWRLYWTAGYTLMEMARNVGFSVKKQPCFDRGSLWWTGSKVAHRRKDSGWRLVNMIPQEKGRNYRAQSFPDPDEPLIRASLETVCEVILTTYKATEARLLEKTYHLSSTRHDRGHVYIGGFDANGITLGRTRIARPKIGVIVEIQP